MKHGTKSQGWSLEYGYPSNSSTGTYPRRAMSAGFSSGFLLLLRAYKQDLDFLCRGPVQGFKVVYLPLCNFTDMKQLSLD